MYTCSHTHAPYVHHRHMHTRQSITHTHTRTYTQTYHTYTQMHAQHARTPYKHPQCTFTHITYTPHYTLRTCIYHTHIAHEAPHITSTCLDSRQGPEAVRAPWSRGPGSRSTGQTSPSACPAPGAQNGKAVLDCPLGGGRYWSSWPCHSNLTYFGSCFMYFAETPLSQS